MRKRNIDRRNAAGGLAEGERTVRKGGWLKFGDDYFYSPLLEKFAGFRVYVNNLEDAFSPLYADCMIEGLEHLEKPWIRIDNLYHLVLKNALPPHLEHLRPRLR